MYESPEEIFSQKLQHIFVSNGPFQIAKEAQELKSLMRNERKLISLLRSLSGRMAGIKKKELSDTKKIEQITALTTDIEKAQKSYDDLLEQMEQKRVVIREYSEFCYRSIFNSDGFPIQGLKPDAISLAEQTLILVKSPFDSDGAHLASGIPIDDSLRKLMTARKIVEYDLDGSKYKLTYSDKLLTLDGNDEEKLIGAGRLSVEVYREVMTSKTQQEKRSIVAKRFGIVDRESYDRIKKQTNGANFLAASTTVTNHEISVIMDLSADSYDDFLNSEERPFLVFDSSNAIVRTDGRFEANYMDLLLDGVATIINPRLQHKESGSCPLHAFAGFLAALSFNDIDELKQSLRIDEKDGLNDFSRRQIYYFNRLMLDMLQELATFSRLAANQSMDESQLESMQDSVEAEFQRMLKDGEFTPMDPQAIVSTDYFINQKEVECLRNGGSKYTTKPTFRSDIGPYPDSGIIFDKGIPVDLYSVLVSVAEKGEADRLIFDISRNIEKLKIVQKIMPNLFEKSSCEVREIVDATEVFDKAALRCRAEATINRSNDNISQNIINN